MNPVIKPPWTREDLARWGIRAIDDCTVEALGAVAPETCRVDPPAGPTPRAHTAPAVVGDAAQDSPSCLRSAAAGCQAAAMERGEHAQRRRSRGDHGRGRVDRVGTLEPLAHADRATSVSGDSPGDPRVRGLYAREYLCSGGEVCRRNGCLSAGPRVGSEAAPCRRSAGRSGTAATRGARQHTVLSCDPLTAPRQLRVSNRTGKWAVPASDVMLWKEAIQGSRHAIVSHTATMT